MRKVAVIIPHYGQVQDTLDCLKSIYTNKSSEISLKIITVINNATGFADSLVQKYPDIITLENRENMGFGVAVNQGIKQAKSLNSDYLIILNNDTLVSDNLIETTVDYLSVNRNAGILSPKIYFYKGQEYHKNHYKLKDLGRVIWYAGGIIDWDNIYASHRGVDDVDHGQFNSIIETDFATGCCMAVRSEVADKIGPFSEKYFLYFEDVEYSLLAKKSGFRVLYFPKTFLWHKNAASSGKPGSPIHIYYQSRNRLYFGFRFAGFRAKKSLFLDSFRLLSKGNAYKKAVVDYYFRQMGKAEV